MFYHPFRHLGLKFLSVGVAVLLWLTVAGEPIVERSLRVQLELQNIPERLEVVDAQVSQIDVRVRGTSSALGHLVPGDVVAVLELDLARPGRRLFHLTPSHVRVPFGIEVVQVSPGTVALEFEASVRKIVPVDPVVDGRPAQGYEIGEVSVDPKTVEVAGPETAVRSLKQAATEPVSVAGLTRTVVEAATIGVADPRVRLNAPQSARVTVQIRPLPSERAIQGVPVHLRNVTASLAAEIVPAVVTVVARGPMDVVSALRADAIVAYVTLAGLGPGRYNLPIRVEPPQDIEIVRTQPAAVLVTIK